VGKKTRQNLLAGSWTEDEVDGLDGKRVRFKRGGEATLKAAGMVDKNGVVFMFTVKATTEDGFSIVLSKGDAASGDWAFEVIS
jgi:hypothetical protein